MRILMMLTKDTRRDPRVLKEARSLTAAGHEIHILEWARHTPGAPPHDTIDGIHIHRTLIPSPDDPPPGAITGNRQWWRQGPQTALNLHQKHAFDAIHCHDLDTLPVGVRLKRRTGLPLIFDAHERFPLMIRQNHPWRVSFIAERMERHLLRHVDALVTVNEPLATHYQQRLRKRAAPVIQVMNCPPLTPKPRAASRRAPLTLAYIGVINRSRWFPHILHAIKDTPNVQLTLAGRIDLDPEETQQVHDAIQAAPNITYLDEIPYDQVMAETRKAHAVLCMYDPRHTENSTTLATKVFEAMMANRPAIVGANTYTGDFVTKHNIGWTAPCNPTSLQNLLHQLDHDRSALDAAGARGRQLAKTQYNWETQAANLTALYAQPPWNAA